MGVFNTGVLEICWRGTDTAELEEGGEIEEMFCASHYTSKHKERGRFTMISGIKEASFPEAVPFQLMVNGELPD